MDETILVVEDDLCVRSLMRMVLVKCGYTVLEAADEAEAFRASEACRGPIPLLIADVLLPGLDWPSVIRKLKGSRPGMQILFTSGYPENVLTELGISVLSENFLHKPFTPQQLAKAVREVLDARGGVPASSWTEYLRAWPSP